MTNPQKFFKRLGDEDEIIHLLSQAIEQSASTVVITDLQGAILYVNRKFTELTGYSRDEVLGKNPRILQSGFTAPEIYREMWRALTQGHEWRGELQNKKKNGELYWESLTVSPIRNEKNVVCYFLGIEEDISKRKSLEADLERTLKELKRSNKELDGFTSVVAHDLQGPLGNIRNAIELALQRSNDRLTAESTNMLSIALNSASKAGELVKDLLQYSRAKAKKYPFAKVDMNTVLTAVIEDYRLELDRTKTEINLNKMPVVIGDTLLLTQLCYNLIGNAIKYRKESILHLQIGVEDKGSFWLFSFVDDGVGIDTEEVSKIFEPFYRIASTSKRPGTGIGLATCQKIVEMHEGKIWAESEIGKGSTFFFTLPKENT